MLSGILSQVERAVNHADGAQVASLLLPTGRIKQALCHEDVNVS